MKRRGFLEKGIAGLGGAMLYSTSGTGNIFTNLKEPRFMGLNEIPVPIPIDESDFARRREKARILMLSAGIDAVIMEGGTTLQYFTGVKWGRSERVFAYILPKDGDGVFLSPAFEQERAREQVKNHDLKTWEEFENPFIHLKDLCLKLNPKISSIALDEYTRYFIGDNLKKVLPSVGMYAANAITIGCRSVKSQSEIALMEIANLITAKVFVSAVDSLKVGMTEFELATYISDEFRKYKSEGGALVLFGKSSASPHGSIKENRLKEGDIVLIDGGCSVEGYQSDVTRTTVFGKATEEMKRVFECVRKAQDDALKLSAPGIEAEKIDAIARKTIVDGGFGPPYKYFTHRLGHGIGMDGHEWNYLVEGNKLPVVTGNVFSNEPGIYIPGKFGVRTEDEMLITDKGARLLLNPAESLEKMF